MSLQLGPSASVSKADDEETNVRQYGVVVSREDGKEINDWAGIEVWWLERSVSQRCCGITVDLVEWVK